MLTLICLLVIGFFLADWIDEADFMLVLCIAVPALTPYTTLAYKRYAEQGQEADNARIIESWFFLMVAPVCLILVLLSVILAKVLLRRFDTIASFATMLLLGESVFGIYWRRAGLHAEVFWIQRRMRGNERARHRFQD